MKASMVILVLDPMRMEDAEESTKQWHVGSIVKKSLLQQLI